MNYNDIPKRLSNFLNYLQFNKKKSIKTVEAYYMDLKMMFKYIKAQRLNANDIETVDITDIDDTFINSIKIDELDSFITYLAAERGNVATSQARKIASIKSFYNYLYIKDIVINNVSLKLENVEIPDRERKSLNLNQVKDLITEVRINDDRKFYFRDMAIVNLFLNCGFRVAELASISLEGIDLKEHKITVIGKRDKERTVKVNNQAWQSLEDYLKWREPFKDKIKQDTNKDGKIKTPLFINRYNERFNDKGIARMIKSYLGCADLDEFTTHSLRHTCATLLYKYGHVDIRSLQKLLGHSNISTTQIYTHIDDEQMEEAVNSMPEF